MSNIYGIINADCDHVLQQLLDKGVRYDLILTDPPYNIGKDFGNNTDKLPLDMFLEAMYRRIDLLTQLLTDQGSIIWFGIHDYIGFIQVYMHNVGLHYRRMNIWHYENGFSRSRKEPATHYEPFLWFSKSNIDWTYNVDEVRVPYKSIERLKSPIKYKGKDGVEKIWHPSDKGAMRGDVWDFPTLSGKAFASERTSHPSQKPESLITEIIKAFCPMTDGKYTGSILDPFHGSGTVGVCCERLNKEGNNIMWTGIEIEKKWCEIARKRIDVL
ncbi:MAG: site-specific DNA-methyltransferase [Bacteroidales bacterium]|nr:site-specific DNA-methyltransferase [Bacteroidales bacterium]MBQ8812272.1 site-specific DNA-methyltransferase [Bacteroidales bacterium]